MVMRSIPRQESRRVGRGCGPGVNQGCPWASASGHRAGTPLGSTLNRPHGRCGAHDTVAGIPPRGRARLLAARPRIGTTLRPCACRKVQDTGNLARGEFPLDTPYGVAPGESSPLPVRVLLACITIHSSMYYWDSCCIYCQRSWE